jgi:fructose-1,6-bisphosphatase/inositol monophosphatase family enzyme
MFNQQKFETASLEAIIASFKQIRPFLLNQKNIGKIDIKPDDTLLTIADHLSENAGFEILRRAFPNLPIIREESGLSEGSADWQIWYDPIDGTAPFSIGAPTSTVICAAYDTINKSLLSVAIGEPAYKRIWTATKNSGCWLTILDDNYNIQTKLPKKVWDGHLSSSTAVFLDLTRGFTRSKDQRQILDNPQMQAIVTSLSLETRLQLYGSNGLHQALVANGNEKVVGGITTAMGGPWDAAGALLIEEAGGKCQAWRLTTDGQITPADYLDPLSYDILAYTNNATTLAFLRHALNNSMII